jgi:hypothetical protein
MPDEMLGKSADKPDEPAKLEGLWVTTWLLFLGGPEGLVGHDEAPPGCADWGLRMFSRLPYPAQTRDDRHTSRPLTRTTTRRTNIIWRSEFTQRDFAVNAASTVRSFETQTTGPAAHLDSARWPKAEGHQRQRPRGPAGPTSAGEGAARRAAGRSFKPACGHAARSKLTAATTGISEPSPGGAALPAHLHDAPLEAARTFHFASAVAFTGVVSVLAATLSCGSF